MLTTDLPDPIAGKVNLFSPDHISLLVHRTFNVSIPRSHIPDGRYVFEHGFADNEEESGGPSTSYFDPPDEMDLDGANGKPRKDLWITEENNDTMIESAGRWIDKTTGEKVGCDDGIVQFTVVGYVLNITLHLHPLI